MQKTHSYLRDLNIGIFKQITHMGFIHYFKILIVNPINQNALHLPKTTNLAS